MNRCNWLTRLFWTVFTGTWWEKVPVGIRWKQQQWWRSLVQILSVTVRTTLREELENLWNLILMVFGCCFLRVFLKMSISSSITVKALNYPTHALSWTIWSTKNTPILSTKPSRTPKPLTMKPPRKWPFSSKSMALIKRWWSRPLKKNKKPQNSISNSIPPSSSKKDIASSTSKIKYLNSRDSKWKEEDNSELQKSSNNKSSPNTWKEPT